MSAKSRRSVGEVSAKCRQSVDVGKAISAETHLERLSTVSRPTIDRLLTAISTDCRPSADQVSTDCRPSVDRVSTATSTAMLTDISVDITHSKQDPVQIAVFSEWNREVRIEKMITKGKLPWSFIKFSQLIFKGNVLTIIPRAPMGSESIAEGRMGYWLRGHE